MKPAVIIVDMIRDNVDRDMHSGIKEEAQKIIPNINRLLDYARSKAFPVVFANDSFLPEDFLFQGKIKPHALRGTPGVEIATGINHQKTDIVLEKRRFSAFFKTDLDITLRNHKVDTIILGGISTNVCVLVTAMDGLAYDFSAIIIENCCACYSREVHEATIAIYSNFADPSLLKIMKLEDLIDDK